MKEIYEFKYCGWLCLLNIDEEGNATMIESTKGKPKKFNDVKFVKIGSNGGERVQYNNDEVSLPFKNYNDGELDKRWRKIK